MQSVSGDRECAALGKPDSLRRNGGGIGTTLTSRQKVECLKLTLDFDASIFEGDQSNDWFDEALGTKLLGGVMTVHDRHLDIHDHQIIRCFQGLLPASRPLPAMSTFAPAMVRNLEIIF